MGSRVYGLCRQSSLIPGTGVCPHAAWPLDVCNMMAFGALVGGCGQLFNVPLGLSTKKRRASAPWITISIPCFEGPSCLHLHCTLLEARFDLCLHVQVCSCRDVYVYVSAKSQNTCTHMRLYFYAPTSVYTCMYMYTYVYMYRYLHMYIQKYIQAHTYMYTHTYVKL